ncbi:MAG: Uma2 family endonuclease [Bacillota bacterium]|nr:Uma2 family endonuclease [Bacillota bacterium]
MDLDEMRTLKKQRGYTNEYIADQTELPLGTVRKIFSGETKHPRFATLQALEAFFREPHAPVYPGPVYDFYPDRPPILVKEKNIDEYYFAKNGSYTASDLDRLRGDDGRGELIHGTLYNMASPTVAHQLIQMSLSFYLKRFVTENGGDCLPLTAPLDVHIHNDDYTVLQPDIIVLCNRDLIRNGKVWGAPDLVIEILSPSTKDRDLYLKLPEYQHAGVREYWIIDPMKQRVIVYDFSNGDLLHLYSFQEKIPVGIWDGDCVIDFSLIASELASVD